MALDITYTNGVIAAKEKTLLGDVILRLCEGDAQAAFRTLCERNFGGGLETATDVYAYEQLIKKEEERISAFVREYAPSHAEKSYFLTPKDFHNAKALLKADYLQTDAQKMLTDEGLIPIALLQSCIANKEFAPLDNDELRTACEEGVIALQKEEAVGAEIGEIFERNLRLHLAKVCRKNATLKKLVAEKTDRQNVLTAFRCQTVEEAVEKYLSGGNLPIEKIKTLFLSDLDEVVKAFSGTDLLDFIRLCVEDKRLGKPLVQAERKLDGYETDYFYKNRYALKANQPFLYYISRRKTECANVRVIVACLLAGFGEAEIKSRLRGV